MRGEILLFVLSLKQCLYGIASRRSLDPGGRDFFLNFQTFKVLKIGEKNKKLHIKKQFLDFLGGNSKQTIL